VEVVGVEVDGQDEGVEQFLQEQEHARLDGFDAPRETDLQGRSSKSYWHQEQTTLANFWLLEMTKNLGD